MYGGRWNSPGRRAIYTANSRALAVLEILANYTVLPNDYVMTPVELPEALVGNQTPRVSVSSYLSQFHDDLNVARYRATGDRLLTTCAVLRVPSVIVPEEYNYVINPEHPDFPLITFLPPVMFRFDPRLKMTGR